MLRGLFGGEASNRDAEMVANELRKVAEWDASFADPVIARAGLAVFEGLLARRGSSNSAFGAFEQ